MATGMSRSPVPMWMAAAVRIAASPIAVSAQTASRARTWARIRAQVRAREAVWADTAIGDAAIRTAAAIHIGTGDRDMPVAIHIYRYVLTDGDRRLDLPKVVVRPTGSGPQFNLAQLIQGRPDLPIGHAVGHAHGVFALQIIKISVLSFEDEISPRSQTAKAVEAAAVRKVRFAQHGSLVVGPPQSHHCPRNRGLSSLEYAVVVRVHIVEPADACRRQLPEVVICSRREYNIKILIKMGLKQNIADRICPRSPCAAVGRSHIISIL